LRLFSIVALDGAPRRRFRAINPDINNIFLLDQSTLLIWMFTIAHKQNKDNEENPSKMTMWIHGICIPNNLALGAKTIKLIFFLSQFRTTKILLLKGNVAY
jgi:hypothetical protein